MGLFNRRAFAGFPVLGYVGVGFGLLVACCGGLLLWLSSPSPHGYIETFFALPAILFGLFVIAASLLLAFKYLNWPLRVLAFALLFASLYPLVELSLFFMSH